MQILIFFMAIVATIHIFYGSLIKKNILLEKGNYKIVSDKFYNVQMLFAIIFIVSIFIITLSINDTEKIFYPVACSLTYIFIKILFKYFSIKFYLIEIV
ncbi:MAG: hypothetical protein ACRDDL_08980 [Sarcina sp.]